MTTSKTLFLVAFAQPTNSSSELAKRIKEMSLVELAPSVHLVQAFSTSEQLSRDLEPLIGPADTLAILKVTDESVFLAPPEVKNQVLTVLAQRVQQV